MTEALATDLPRLGRHMVSSIVGHLTSDRVILPTPAMLDLPETVVQFGTGAFLRGFVDDFLDEANRRGRFAGRAVAIASTESGRDAALNDQDGLYTLVVAGTDAEREGREYRVISSVSRALSAQREWGAVLSLARRPEIELVFSNTTEVGIVVDDDDALAATPPPSFPGKLTRFLLERGRAFHYAHDGGVVVVPCELIERNGDRLRALVLQLARRWRLEAEFAHWVESTVPFCNSLVDRIVPGKPDGASRREQERALGFRDELMITAEPHRLFAIEAPIAVHSRLRFADADEGVVLTGDITPFRQRKVRILNGGHSLIAPLGLLVGCETVREAVRHELIGPYLRRVLFDEIVPSLTVPAGEGEAFARDVLARFANPLLRHALRDITLEQTAKLRVRVVPSIVALAERAKRAPAALAFGFAAYLLSLRGAVRLPADGDGERIRGLWRSVMDADGAALGTLVMQTCGDQALWGVDLTRLAGFAKRVTEDLAQMMRHGVASALAAHLLAVDE